VSAYFVGVTKPHATKISVTATIMENRMKKKVKIGHKSFDYFEEAQGYFKGFLERTSIDVPFASKSKLKTQDSLNWLTMIELYKFHPNRFALLANWEPKHFTVTIHPDSKERVFAAHFKGGHCILFDEETPCIVAFIEDDEDLFDYLSDSSNDMIVG
jgi:hypothetical protein